MSAVYNSTPRINDFKMAVILGESLNLLHTLYRTRNKELFEITENKPLELLTTATTEMHVIQRENIDII